MLIAVDQKTDHLVGMNSIAKSAIVEGILGRIFPAAREIRSDIVGQNFVPNVEALAAARPDLVIQWGGRGDDIVKPLTNAGLAVALILYGTETQARGYMTMSGTALGKMPRVESLLAWRSKVENEIAAIAAKIPPERKPKVLHLGAALTQLSAAGAGGYSDFYIRLGGGLNAATDMNGARAVNAEQIAAWDPDIILLNSFEDKLTVERIYQDPILSFTAAARTKRVYKMPLGGYRWDPPNQESPLVWMWLAGLMHPGLFKYDLRAEMRAAYAALYGHQLSDAEIDEILRMPMQGNAAHYAQFKAR
jgi:iron complex transport system substrate-binding protein